MRLLIPLSLGVVMVMQGALNRRISLVWGLLPTALLNAAIFWALVTGCYLWARTGSGPLASFVHRDLSLRDMQAYWLLPGLFGFAIVLGLPWSIQRLGALHTFVVVVAAQMAASLLWDRLAEGIAIDARRLLGALLAVAGALLVSWKR